MASKKERRPAGRERSAVTLGSLTHVGMKRAGNEDAYLALAGANAPASSDALMAVADGMGGHQAGEVASAMAIQGLVSRFTRDGRKEQPTGEPEPLAARLQRAVQEINSDVFRGAARPESKGMGTTLTASLLAGSTLFISHVGDSRAYMLRKRKLIQLTQDHSWVAEEVARGALTPQQAEKHPARNVLTRALGMADAVQVDSVAVRVEEGDVLLYASDGLHGLVSDEEIGRVLSTEEPQQACRALVDRANSLGGHDNVTVVIARVDRVRQTGDTADSQQGLHQMTTMQVKGAKASGSLLKKSLLILLSPLWVPVWLVVKMLKFPFRRGR